MIKVLILSRDPAWFGGVVNFVDLLSYNFSKEIISEPLMIGRRKNADVFLRVFVPMVDAVRLFERLKNNDYDVVHLNPSFNRASLLRDGLFILVLKACRPKAVFVTWHGWDVKFAESVNKWPYRFIFKRVFSTASSMWVLASSFGQQLKKLGVDPRDVSQFTTMFDGSIFKGRKRNRKSDKIRLLFLSRFEKAKGVYELLDAFSRISRQYDFVELMFAGNGPEMDGMQAWVQNHKLNEKISFAGYLRDGDKVQALLDADIFVFPTYYGEGCPVSLLEAMAAGLPVITAPAGGIPGIFQNERNGFLLSEVSSGNIEKALNAMIIDSDLRHTFGEENRKEAWEKYEAGVVTKKIETHYRKLSRKGNY